MSDRIKPTWPEAVEPTPDQFVGWFLLNHREEQERIAAELLAASGRAADCYLRHKRIEADLDWLRRRANRYRLAWASARRCRRAEPREGSRA